MKRDIGDRPTEEEWEVYERVLEYHRREQVVDWLDYNHPEATEEQFEYMCDAYAGYWREDGDHDWSLLWEAWDAARRATF